MQRGPGIPGPYLLGLLLLPLLIRKAGMDRCRDVTVCDREQNLGQRALPDVHQHVGVGTPGIGAGPGGWLQGSA